jgi:tRNA nucleotidyltransferase (CCA-adding enzyme)
MTRDMLSRVRFAGAVVESCESLVRSHMYSADPELSEPALRRFIRRIGKDRLDRQFALRAADIAGSGLPKRDDSNERFQERVYAEVARKPAFSIADLKIDGSTVVSAMISRGLVSENYHGDKRVGDALAYLFEQVTEQPGRNEPDTLRTLLEQYLGGF